VAATTQVDDDTTSFRSVKNMSGLAEARGTVLGMSLDRMSDSVSGQTVIDPKGYLTSLANTKIATNAEVGDIHKARLLLKSVRDTNPSHGPGWIASARVEEAAGKILQARKLIREGCEVCPEAEDVWLEAARLHPVDVARSILATAVRRIPTSVKIFLRAADLETNDAAKKAVLRKALETNPTSVTLWKAAIELEDADDARVLLSVAVERVPHSVEMWLALARLETYENARKVLNQARRAIAADRSIWIAAAKLEESQNHNDVVDKIIDKAVKSLAKHDAIVTRAQWLQEAEIAEAAGAPMTSAAIVKHTIGLGVDPEDQQRTWSEDTKGVLSRGSVATARAILAHSLGAFPSKRSLWLQAVELERKHGNATSLDEVLAAASERLPRAEIFWLFRAKERWLAGDIDKAREILTDAFAANPDSEQVWLAAAKLEWETGEVSCLENVCNDCAPAFCKVPNIFLCALF
jgi:pre-mRNA-processing factor 6